MDAQLASESGTPPTWDFYVEPIPAGGDIVPIIAGSQETAQEAAVAATLLLNGIPQLPGVGVDHLGFLAGTVLFGELDAQIRTAIANTGNSQYVPSYDIVNNGLTITVQLGATS